MDQSVRDLLTAIAEPTPVPGGGSVSALNGAVAASLVEMVCSTSAKKKSLADKAEDLNELAASARRYREELVELVDRDAAAYATVGAAFKLPKETDEQKATRNQAIQDGLKLAAEVPFRTAQCCLAVMHLAVAAAEMGHAPMITDAAVAGLTAAAGTEGAVLNVRINLADITDQAWHGAMVSELLDLTTDMGETAETLRAILAGIAPIAAPEA